MDQVATFLNDPLVAPLYALLVVALIDFLLGMYRAFQQGAFDWQKLPGVLDSTVLQKVVPLAALGAAAFLVTDPTAKTGLQAAYVIGCTTALAGEVASFIQKITGGFTATTKAQDRAAIPNRLR